MFYTDSHYQLELHRQHADELHREAAAYRLARELSATRRDRFGWWHRGVRRSHPVTS